MHFNFSKTICRAVLFAGLFSYFASLPVAAAPPSRLVERLDSGRTFALPGAVEPRLASAVDEGEVEPSLPLPRITIHFKMTDAQQAELDRLLQAQQDPSSPQYHQWLTPEQFAGRFGLSESDLARIAAWLRQLGFSDIQPARSRTFVQMAGTASQVRLAFGTGIRHYRVNGKLHYANSSDPVLPRALKDVVSGIRGLNDFHPRPHAIRRSSQPQFTSSISGNHFIAPGDFAVIYDVQPLYSSGIDGTGEKIAVAGQTDIKLSDIHAFQTASGLPVKDPQIILDGSDPGTLTGDETEADLDIEWSGAVARGATIVYVNSSDALTSAIYAIDQNVAPVLSISYGACENETPSGELVSLNFVFQQANAQGITVVAASGDQGAADCDVPATSSAPPVTSASKGLSVDFPASSPYVTGAGGTEFNEGGKTYWSATNNSNAGSALSYIPEMTWNDTATDKSLSASGGGKSTHFAKPYWQTGAGVPADNFRDVPDIALNASPDHDPYLICDAGWCTNGYRNSQTFLDAVGGTSAATPAFAGIVALINQKMHGRQGNINPALYALAASAPEAFHDITTGSNIVPCVVGKPNCTTGTMGYTAGPGYDQVTGLGSVDAFTLVNAMDGIKISAPVVLSNSGEFFAPSQGSGTVGVTVTGAGSWTASTTANWITITGPASGTGDGAVTFTIAANTGAARSGLLTINGQTFTISQETASASLTGAGSISQIASGGGWDTSLTLVDLGTASADARVDFSGNAGSALVLPFTSPQQTFAGTMLGATLEQTLNPHGQFIMDSAGSSGDPVSVGWAQFSTGGAVNGFAIFKNGSGQEAVVPLETRTAPSYLLAYDNSGDLATGLAIANPANTAAAVNVIIRDDTGAQIGTRIVNLPAQGHQSFMLTDPQSGFPVTLGKRGTIEFDTPQNGHISVLGLRAKGAAVTTLPVLANIGSGGGRLAHIASGGGWQTLITLVNTGGSPAPAQLNFLDEQGNPMVLPLLFPQTGVVNTTSSVSQTLAAGASLLIQTQGVAAQVGSARLTTAGAVSGFAIFQKSGQEAVVPLAAGAPSSITLAFDNTNGLANGVALANGSASPVVVPVTLYDETGATLGTSSINLPANGHVSFIVKNQFPMAANIRGSLVFSSSSPIAALGIRAAASGAYTSIPAMTQ
jgi:pro-kumamolisin-like protein/subtilase family protein/all-beta uncharacterized protein